MEVWKIGNSNPAPNFHILTKPNNWFKTIKNSLNTTEITETKTKQLRFWDGFKSYCETNKISLNLRKTSPQHWYDISFGRSDCHIALTINSQKKELGCEIYIPNAMETFAEFKKHQNNINSELDNLEWMELPTKKASRIKVCSKGDFSNEAKWENHFQWLCDQALKFQKTFGKY
jgi:Domain of unknown function (DUF4268)